MGSKAVPLTETELKAVWSQPLQEGDKYINLGVEPTANVTISVGLNAMLSRHVAILGCTGQGKTHFVAALVQQLLAQYPRSRIVIFDVNGEYSSAFSHLGTPMFAKTQLGVPSGVDKCEGVRIPYYALGRSGLIRLLLPSERTQLPALRFAIENLKYVQSDGNGACLVGDNSNRLFDDARKDGAEKAASAIDQIRTRSTPQAAKWPHMRAISCLAAEWYALQQNSRGVWERNTFLLGHIQSLINRIRGFIEDDCFCRVIDVEGGDPHGTGLDWRSESTSLVERLFGDGDAQATTWSVHVIDVSRIAQDLMPYILGALLELYATELFLRGPGKSHPTLLVLEEAHHYMQQMTNDIDLGIQALAYERLAKEGRKFNVSLLVSTQRAAELSSTVLSQCGTWFVFRLTNERDIGAVNAASEWGSRYITNQIPNLPRGQAIVIGSSVPFAQRISVLRPDPSYKPDSLDANFVNSWSKESNVANGLE